METKALNYIKALTAKGGDHYAEFEQYDTPDYRDAFEQWLEGQSKSKGEILWRGYTFERGYWEDGLWSIEAGEVLVDNMTAGEDVPAFTDSPLRAANYINEFGNGIGLDDSVRVLFKVQTEGKYCVNISNLSYYKPEREYRCVRDARFELIGIKDKGFFIEVAMREK